MRTKIYLTDDEGGFTFTLMSPELQMPTLRAGNRLPSVHLDEREVEIFRRWSPGTIRQRAMMTFGQRGIEALSKILNHFSPVKDMMYASHITRVPFLSTSVDSKGYPTISGRLRDPLQIFTLKSRLDELSADLRVNSAA